MKKIILDTNFLMAVGQFKVDIFSEISRICDFKYDVFILDKSLVELNDVIKGQKLKQRMAAKLALKLIDAGKVKIKSTYNGIVDDLIVSIADKDVIVGTQDKELKRRLKEKGIELICIRQKKYLNFC